MKKRDYRLWMTLSRSVNIHHPASDSETFPKKKLRLMHKAQGGVTKQEKERVRLVVFGALFLDKFNEQFQFFRLHIGQNAVTEVKNVA